MTLLDTFAAIIVSVVVAFAIWVLIAWASTGDGDR